MTLSATPLAAEPAEAFEKQFAPITLDRARQLNSAMLSVCFEREGLRKVSAVELTLLREASLIEMVQAGPVVKRHEDLQPADENGIRSFSLVCDDRLVAAIYAFVNFGLPPASSPSDDDYIILKITDTTHTYFLISGAREKRPDTGEDEGDD